MSDDNELTLDMQQIHALVATPLGQAELFKRCRLALGIGLNVATDYEDSLLAGIITARRLRRCENAQCPFPPKAWQALREELELDVANLECDAQYLKELLELVRRAEGQLYVDEVARPSVPSAHTVD